MSSEYKLQLAAPSIEYKLQLAAPSIEYKLQLASDVHFGPKSKLKLVL